MILKGKAFVFGDNIDTDAIIPARYLNTSDPNELAQYCMEGIRPGFARDGRAKGAVLVAGRNFGCGSSREHAPISIKHAGIQCVIARSFARIFLRNCINIGLPAVELEEASSIEEGDLIEVDLKEGIVINRTKVATYRIQPYPDFMMEIIRAGGWLKYVSSLKKGVEK